MLQPEKVRLEEEIEKVLSLKPDLIVTAAFGQILPKRLLDGPKYGCINVHASLLPELRGGAPIHYSILQGKKKTGVTIMYMVEKLDAGDMISKIEVEIDETDNVGTLHDKLSIAGQSFCQRPSRTSFPEILNRSNRTNQKRLTRLTLSVSRSGLIGQSPRRDLQPDQRFKPLACRLYNFERSKYESMGF
ncbi:methionyl-tRNA formyltransferase [Bacillus velezensis]|nr:methionyl-tRNA formyltransferase [Bacillus velezensis]